MPYGIAEKVIKQDIDEVLACRNPFCCQVVRNLYIFCKYKFIKLPYLLAYQAV